MSINIPAVCLTPSTPTIRCEERRGRGRGRRSGAHCDMEHLKHVSRVLANYRRIPPVLHLASSAGNEPSRSFIITEKAHTS